MQGRWRALGNIQFVGQLYKKRMLTEKIMHECIKSLLEDVSIQTHPFPKYSAHLQAVTGKVAWAIRIAKPLCKS